MRVLLVGSGGREHALAWRISQSPKLTQLWVAGGNAGTAALAENLNIRSSDVDGLVAKSGELKADLVVVGPEAPLAMGLADQLTTIGIPVFGPSQAAAQIEASKGFALELMQEASVPCPDFTSVQDESGAQTYINNHPGPLVVKADGLAAGKGVLMCDNSDEVQAAVRMCMTDRAFGEAGATVVLEEYLKGPEVSVFAFCDGEHLSPLVAACDYKRQGDGDTGPNTGGMGSFSRPDFWTSDLENQVKQDIMLPVLRAMAHRGTPYKGVLYAGLMLTGTPSDWKPKVLEFNCRLGDPETQVVMPLLDSDPLELMIACAEGGLDKIDVRWNNNNYVGVVMVSGGYPDEYRTGFEITGLADDGTEDAMVFHAGTKLGTTALDGPPLTAGGRVLTVVGGGDTIESARERAYSRLESISFEGAAWRTDIGTSAHKGVARSTR